MTHVAKPKSMRTAWSVSSIPSFPYRAMAAARAQHPVAIPHPAAGSADTLLADVAILNRSVDNAQVDAWKCELDGGTVLPVRAAWLHVWLGEVALAR